MFTNRPASDLCKVCPADQFQAVVGSSSCNACADDTKIDDTTTASAHDNPSDCSLSGISCNTAERRTTKGTCEKCPTGSEVSPEQTSCRLCPIGTYNDVPGGSCKACTNDDALCSLIAGAISQTSIPETSVLKQLAQRTKDNNDNANITYISESTELNTLQTPEACTAESKSYFQQTYDGLPGTTTMPIYSVLFSLCFTIVVSHRCFPTACKNIDVMFAKSHFIDDKHAMRSLDTRLGAAFNLVLFIAVVGICVFVYGEPNILATYALIPAPQVVSSDQNSTTFGKLQFHITAYAPRKEDCSTIEIPSFSSGLSCTKSIAPGTESTEQLTVCNLTVACDAKFNFRGTEQILVKIPDAFQNMEWDVQTSRWSTKMNATKISHMLSPSTPTPTFKSPSQLAGMCYDVVCFVLTVVFESFNFLSFFPVFFVLCSLRSS
jgi:hypothetical protein